MSDRYQGFVFSPADLSEDVELDVERRKEILFADAHLAQWTHWQVLGLPWNAPAAAAKAAYLEKVKIFHPDRYAGKRLGSYRARLERIFRRITEARDVLTDEARRAAYAKASAPADEFARLEARKLEDERRAEERRARLARQNPLMQRAARVAELLERGKAALAEGRFAQAANDLLLAQGLDPKNAELAALAADAKRKAGAAKATELFRKGLEAEALGNARQGPRVLPRGARGRSRERAGRGVRRQGGGGARRPRLRADAGGRGAPGGAAQRRRARGARASCSRRRGTRRRRGRRSSGRSSSTRRLEGAKERLKKLRWGFLG